VAIVLAHGFGHAVQSVPTRPTADHPQRAAGRLLRRPPGRVCPAAGGITFRDTRGGLSR
jgi:hypothetical protein